MTDRGLPAILFHAFLAGTNLAAAIAPQGS